MIEVELITDSQGQVAIRPPEGRVVEEIPKDSYLRVSARSYSSYSLCESCRRAWDLSRDEQRVKHEGQTVLVKGVECPLCLATWIRLRRMPQAARYFVIREAAL